MLSKNIENLKEQDLHRRQTFIVGTLQVEKDNKKSENSKTTATFA
jgi:hypothetical protein